MADNILRNLAALWALLCQKRQKCQSVIRDGAELVIPEYSEYGTCDRTVKYDTQVCLKHKDHGFNII